MNQRSQRIYHFFSPYVVLKLVAAKQFSFKGPNDWLCNIICVFGWLFSVETEAYFPFLFCSTISSDLGGAPFG